MQLTPGTVIDGRYEVITCLGAGGMSVVYQAWQKDFDRFVAVKVLSNQYAASEPEQSRLQREALALSALKHRSIVGFYGFGVWAGFPYMVMECVQGQSLQALLDIEDRLPVDRAMRIVSQVCLAVGAAHKHGIIHRDLKPSNVMLVEQDGEEVVKIIDFGLVFLLPAFGRDQQKLTDAGVAVGSVLYMSPEQCVGATVDNRSDLYSIGAVLHHCLTGRPPFMFEDAASVMAAHLHDKPRSLVEIDPRAEWPWGLQSVLYRSMAKDARDRYASADEMLADLEAVEQGRGEQMKFDCTSNAPARKRSLRLAFLIASIALICLVSVLLTSKNATPISNGPATAKSSSQLYRLAAGLEQGGGERAKQRELLEQCLVANQSDKMLEGYALFNAQFMLTECYSDLHSRPKAQEATYRLLRDPWFENLPLSEKIMLYDRAGQTFEYDKAITKDNCVDYDSKRRFLYDRIRRELEKYEHRKDYPVDVSILLPALADISDSPDQLPVLLDELKANYGTGVISEATAVRIAQPFLKYSDSETRKRILAVCAEAKKVMVASRRPCVRLAESLAITCEKIGLYEDAYSCAAVCCHYSNTAPIYRIHMLLVACMALERLGRHAETAPYLSDLKTEMTYLSPSEVGYAQVYLSDLYGVLRRCNRDKEAQELKQQYKIKTD